MRALAVTLSCAVVVICAEARAQFQDASHRGVLVHIESPQSVDLERQSDDRRKTFYLACSSPCDEEVPADGKYRIAGDAARPSGSFVLLDANREDIVVEPRSRAWFDVGLVLVGVGGLATGLGGLALVANAFADDPNGPSESGSSIGLGLPLPGSADGRIARSGPGRPGPSVDVLAPRSG